MTSLERLSRGGGAAVNTNGQNYSDWLGEAGQVSVAKGVPFDTVPGPGKVNLQVRAELDDRNRRQSRERHHPDALV